MPTVVRKGVKSQRNGSEGTLAGASSPTSEKFTTSPNGGRNQKGVDINENGEIGGVKTLPKPVDALSDTSGGSGLGILPVGENNRDLASEASSKELVLVDKDREVEPEDGDYDERKDLVLALPDGWPAFKNRPWRRRSCELVKSTCSCVRKAVSHLHQLQDILDAFYKSGVFESASREGISRESKTQESSLGESAPPSRGYTESQTKEGTPGQESASSHGRKIRWLLSSASLGQLDEDLATPADLRLESSASGAQLEVRGTSAGVQSTTPLTPKPPTAKSESEAGELELPPGYTVIDEVLGLLGRLETDRVNTEQTLVKERERVCHLGNEIDRHAYQRMLDLPTAVQREHEACAIDINELRWHCAYTGRIETRLRERVRQAEMKHAKLLQDLGNMQKHCPLVEEKLDLEGEAMSSIQNKQDETDDELSATLERLNATEKKTAEAQGKASQERGLIKQDVDVVRNELNAVSDELAQLKMYFTSNTHTMHDIRNTLKENAQLLTVLDSREERIRALEGAQQDKVKRLREKIVEQEAEHHKLVEENSKLMTEKEVMKASLATDISKLEYRTNSTSSRVKELTKRNRESTSEIRSIKKKRETCAKQQVSDAKSTKRAEAEMEKVDVQLMVSKEETNKVEVMHNSLTDTLLMQKEEMLSVEESLKTTAEALKKQLKDEGHARTVLQARITADNTDLGKTQVDSKKKREKATIRADEIEKLVSHVKEQVAKLEKIHNERQMTISELNKILQKVAIQHNDMATKLTGEVSGLRPKEEDFKKENMDLTKKIDHMTWKGEMMEKKMQDMASSSIMMYKVIATTTEAINDLNEEMTELKIQIETGFETEQDLRTSLTQAEDRIRIGRDDHKNYMRDRDTVLQTNLRGVQTSLEENRRLAETYTRLQKTFLNSKAALLREFERRVFHEHSVKDHRELSVLQERMHEALQYYYRLRGLQNRAGIAQFELRAAENGGKLVWLQSEMMRVIEHINRFLEANNAAHTVISKEAANVAKTPQGVAGLVS